MFNPFVKLEPAMIPALVKAGQKWLVTQSFPRGDLPGDQGQTRSLLCSEYDDPDTAAVHKKTLTDRYAAILRLEYPPHRKKLTELLQPGSGYLLWLAIVASRKETETKLNRLFSERINRFLAQQTNWKIDPSRLMTPVLQVTFGELYLILKYGSRQIKVGLEEIEKY